MTGPRIPDGFPDVRTFLLPSRAYLLSFRDQTLPSRRTAISDAWSYFEAVGNEEGHRAQLALLGLMGEALQVVEDVGVMGHAFMKGIPGLSFYVAATAYDPSNVNNFYSQIHKRDDDYFLGFAALKIAGVSVTDTFTFEPPLDDATRVAVGAAEHATALLLRDVLGQLAKHWEEYRQFFHAFKHGALIANPDDVHVMRDREEVIARMAIWRRRREGAELGTHTNAPLAELATRTGSVAALALDTAQYVAETRLRVYDWIRFTEDGSVEQVGSASPPWAFWFRGRDIDDAHISRLKERLGIRFETRPDTT
jgi:hypothetical protein